MAGIPDEDRVVLSGVGYDVAVEIGLGAYGAVFSGVCNENAFKECPISEEEIEFTNFEVVRSSSGQPFVKKLLLGKSCAIKQIDKSSPTAPPDGLHRLNEAAVLVTLSHPNIVELYSIVQSPQYGYVVMEYTNGGTLAQLMVDYRMANKMFTEWEVNDLFRGMIEGLSYLHSMGVEHRDLHSENIMINIDDNNRRQIKYVDFGLSLEAQEAPNYTNDVVLLGVVFEDILAESNFRASPICNELAQIIDAIQRKEPNVVYQSAVEVRNALLPVLARMQSNPVVEVSSDAKSRRKKLNSCTSH